MKMMRTSLTSAALWLLTLHVASAADAANGERLATRWCSSCHLIAPGQTKATTDVPTFSEIAHKPGIDAQNIAYFLLVPHPRMPDMSLTRNEAQDIAAYITSLR